MDGKSLNITQEKLNQLKQLFPEVFKENKIDFVKLKTILGEDLVIKNEAYNLSWNGKYETFKEIQKQTTATLHPYKSAGIDFDNAENIFIEGENLEVLRILQKSYFGKIKMIYIDPPYNTGNDSFVYPDSYKERKNDYQKKAGIINENGFLNKQEFWKKNSRENGQFHSVWLSMMYPRLYLSRNLLAENGVIFISIDDMEAANLKLMLDEIYGSENFVGQIIWQTATDNNATQISIEHEYILCYAKNISEQNTWEIPTEKGKHIQTKYEELLKKYGNKPEQIQSELRTWINTQKKNSGIDLSGVSHYSYVDEIGVFYPGNSANTKPGGYSYDILHPTTNQICAKPNYGYRFKKETFDNAAQKGDVLWGKDETTIPKIKKRLNTATEKLKSYYYEDNRTTTNNLANLFNGIKVFDNPKSVNLLKHLIKYTVGKNDIILDFFAGSGSIAEAVLEINKEENSNRKFICIQINEACNPKSEAVKLGYNFISQITLDRIVKIINQQKAEEKNSLNLSDYKSSGVKVFRLGPSNFKIWQSDGLSPDNLLEQLEFFVNPLKPHTRTDNLLYELLLKLGFPLTISIENLIFTGVSLFSLQNKKVLIALHSINNEIIPEICTIKPELFICLDELFNNDNQLKSFLTSQLQQYEINFYCI